MKPFITQQVDDGAIFQTSGMTLHELLRLCGKSLADGMEVERSSGAAAFVVRWWPCVR
ncbi:MAG: hypothetical protein H8M99_13685 [Gloeobacteraceae cyanobacterium ES-bin-144]|nr:hypothetical protein [Verrucomicrobiales bacterium]